MVHISSQMKSRLKVLGVDVLPECVTAEDVVYLFGTIYQCSCDMVLCRHMYRCNKYILADVLQCNHCLVDGCDQTFWAQLDTACSQCVKLQRCEAMLCDCIVSTLQHSQHSV